MSTTTHIDAETLQELRQHLHDINNAIGSAYGLVYASSLSAQDDTPKEDMQGYLTKALAGLDEAKSISSSLYQLVVAPHIESE